MSSNFEKLNVLGAELDQNGMLDLVSAFPANMDDAWERGERFAGSLKKVGASRIVVCGMGGSAIGGDLVRSFLGDRLEIPLHVNRSFGVARSLVADSVFVFSSYSGNTSETLSAFESVRKSGRPALAITSGGELASRCKKDGIPVCEIPGGMPPRAAIAYSFFPLLHSLSALGFGRIDNSEREEARAVLETLCRTYRAEVPENRACALAFELDGKLPLLYAGSGLLEAVARRWSTQINENAKSLAHLATFPELTHNEIVGWAALAPVRENAMIVRFEDEDDDPVARRQAEIAMEIIGHSSAGVVNVSGESGGRLTRILSAMILGDFVSVYLSYLNGVDPTPVENIDHLKHRLKQGH